MHINIQRLIFFFAFPTFFCKVQGRENGKVFRRGNWGVRVCMATLGRLDRDILPRPQISYIFKVAFPVGTLELKQFAATANPLLYGEGDECTNSCYETCHFP